MSERLRKILFSLAILFSVLLLLLVSFRIYGYVELEKAAAAFNKELGPLKPLGSYAPKTIPETENGGIVLQGGAYATVLTTEERGFLRQTTEKPVQEWDTTIIEKARPLVLRNEPAYQVMAQAVPFPLSNLNLKFEMGAEMPIPNFLSFIQAKTLVGARARLLLLEGKNAEALGTMAVQERLAAALVREPLAISCLIGHTAQKDYNALVQEALFRFDLAGLQEIEKQMQHLKSSAISLKQMLASEGAGLYSSMSEKYLDESDDSSMEESLPLVFYTFNRRLYLAHFLSHYAELGKESDQPLTQTSQESRWSMRRIVKDASAPNLTDLVTRTQAVQSESNLAQLAVKLCIHAKQKGAYPADLSQLAPPDSPYSGEPVQYKVQPDGSAVLSYPKGEKLWDDTHKNFVPRKPLLTWRLPAPTEK